MVSFLRTTPVDSIDIRGSRVLCAASVPDTSHIVYATDAPELICPPRTRVHTDSFAHSLASARYASFDTHSLPEQKAVILALLDGQGLRMYSFPDLQVITSELATELRGLSKTAHIFSVDSLGSDVVSESFRVAIACLDTVFLLDVNPKRGKVVVLGQHKLEEQLVAVAFSEMTIVASTIHLHYMLRVSRGGGLAVAATVSRTEKPRRSAASAAVGESGAVVMSFLGGLFMRRDLTLNGPPVLALALPDNQWLLTVDKELITYSSFGAKLDEMENVFKSKTGMEVNDTASSVGKPSSPDGKLKGTRSVILRSGSVSSLGSVATGMSHMTYIDQTRALRSEKPPAATVFSPPFVLSVTSNNELMSFAANGSVPGVIDHIPIVMTNAQSKPLLGVKIVASRYDHVLATAFWPNGSVVTIEIVDDLATMTEQMEAEQQFRYALALVPAENTDRMIALRRLLASEARELDWHDAAMHHLQVVVNLSMRMEGIDQVDLVTEAVELRGSKDSSWYSDIVTATMWADFLFRLRRRVMRPCAKDVDILETLCRADESAARVKSLFSVKHDIALNAGESLITSADCMLREEERVEALVALYTSLSEHGKALLLLENSELTNSYDGVVGYLSNSMRACDNVEVFFAHLKWTAHRVSEEAQGRVKVEQLVDDVVADAEDSDVVMGRLMEVLVEEMDDLAIDTADAIAPVESSVKSDGASNGQGIEKGCKGGMSDFSGKEIRVSADVAAAAILAGMSKANSLQKQDVFDKLRELFNSRILQSTEASYHAFTLLQGLQAERYKALGLHEEQAFLLGQQGRHEAAADELASERGLGAGSALTRLTRMLPASDKGCAAEWLVSAYVRVSGQGRAMRIKDASEVVRCAGGSIEIEKVLLDGRCGDEDLRMADMWPFLKEAVVSGNERLRIAELLRALRKCEVARLREEVLSRRRRFVVVGHERACCLCTRRIGDSVFAAYPDGSIAHLACHMSKDSR